MSVRRYPIQFNAMLNIKVRRRPAKWDGMASSVSPGYVRPQAPFTQTLSAMSVRLGSWRPTKARTARCCHWNAYESDGQGVVRGRCNEYEGPDEGTARGEWKGMNNGDGAAGTEAADGGMGRTDSPGITRAGMRVRQSCGRPAGDLWQMQLRSLQIRADVWCGLLGCLPVLGPCKEADKASVWEFCQDGVWTMSWV